MAILGIRRRARALALAILALTTTQPALAGNDAVPNVAANKSWDCDASSAMYTGGGHGAMTIQIVLDKGAISGRALTIQSDGDHILLGEGGGPDDGANVTLDVASKGATDADGATSSLLLVAGEHPSIAFNGKDSVRESGRWRRIAHAPGKTLTLTISRATFANIKFAPGTGGATAAPAPPAVSVAPGPVAYPGPLANGTAVKQKSVKLKTVASNFADAVSKPCLNCHASGTVMVSVQVGTIRQGAFVVPRMENQPRQCTRCKGTGQIHAPVATLLARTTDLLQTLINLDLDDPSSPAVLKTTYDMVTNNVIGNKDCWDTFTLDARSTLSLERPTLNKPLITEVMVDKAETDAEGHRTYNVHLPGTTNTFIVENPPSADNVSSGPVLMGGLLDHVLPPRDGKPAVKVLKGAFIISPDIKRQWSWWVSHEHGRFKEKE